MRRVFYLWGIHPLVMPNRGSIYDPVKHRRIRQQDLHLLPPKTPAARGLRVGCVHVPCRLPAPFTLSGQPPTRQSRYHGLSGLQAAPCSVPLHRLVII